MVTAKIVRLDGTDGWNAVYEATRACSTSIGRKAQTIRGCFLFLPDVLLFRQQLRLFLLWSEYIKCAYSFRR